MIYEEHNECKLSQGYNDDHSAATNPTRKMRVNMESSQPLEPLKLFQGRAGAA